MKRKAIMDHIFNSAPLRDRRRGLRHQQTDAERKLWSRLRNKQLFGFKFRRQVSVGSYILDFYCPEKRLAIELDGGQHVEQEHYDEKRTMFLNSMNIQVFRFWNNEVLNSIDSVVAEIARVLGQ